MEENYHRCSVMLGSEKKDRHMEGLVGVILFLC